MLLVLALGSSVQGLEVGNDHRASIQLDHTDGLQTAEISRDS